MTGGRLSDQPSECPVGLDIKAVSVPEIAISIAARLVQKRAEHQAQAEGPGVELPSGTGVAA